jgi:cardiolipin synthase
VKPLPLPRFIRRPVLHPIADDAWRYVRQPERLRPHTLVIPLRSGEDTFPAMLAAIRAARRLIHFEMYILRADRVGMEFRDALVERAQAGVAVRLLYDAVGSLALADSFLEPLRAAGGKVAVFHPVAPWRRTWGSGGTWGLNRRDHKKILIVDDREGFTGGINIGLEYASKETGGDGWLDWNARVEGPAVYELALSFQRTWAKTTGERLAEPPLPGPALGRNVLGTQVVDNTNVRSRWRMHRAYLHAIAAAERDISILNAYFIPGRSLRRAFREAAARGVSVRAIVPSDSDVKAVHHASRHLYRRLMAAGMRIFEWPESMMHAKVGIIDGVWSTIGSYNLDHRSLMHNLEVSLVCIDGPLAATLQGEFEVELAQCQEVTTAALDSLAPWERFKDWFWYQLRSQL